MPLPTISPSGVSTAFQYPTQPSLNSGGFTTLIGAIPPSVNAPIIFEPWASFSGNQLKVVMIVTAQPANWGGAQVWGSMDGTTYGQLGVVYRGGVQGSLIANFPSHSDPDTVNTLSVDVGESGGQINSGSTGDADHGTTLAYVDGEFVGYSTVTLVSPFKYNLTTYLRRGMFSTPISAHLAGSNFGLINSNLFSQIYPANMIGQTVYFKFPSFNSVGANIQDISLLPAYSYVLTGVGQSPTGGGTGLCPLLTVLSGGASADLGSVGECISSSCDLGLVGTPVILCIDLGWVGGLPR